MKKSRKTGQEWQQLLAACKARPKGIRIPDWCDQQGIWWRAILGLSKWKAALMLERVFI